MFEKFRTRNSNSVSRQTAVGSQTAVGNQTAETSRRVPLDEISQAIGIPEERLAMMAQMIHKNGLADEQMGPMMKTAVGNGVKIDTIMTMLTSLGVPSEQVIRVACSQGLMDEKKGQQLLAQEKASHAASAESDARAARRHSIKKAAIIVFWFAVWQLLDTLMNNQLVLAGPVRVAQALVDRAAQPDFWMICGASFLRIAAGFLLSFVVGIVLALAAYRVQTVRDFLDPIISLLRTIPVVSIIIMLLIWVGNQLLTIYLSFLIVLPLIYMNMLTGFENVDPQMLEMARVYKLSPWRTFAYIYRPAFMPFLASASKLALGMSWKSGIMAEVLATPRPSIGREMAQARTYLNTPDLFAWTVVVMIMSWAFEKFSLWILKKLGRPWGGNLGSKDFESRHTSSDEKPAEVPVPSPSAFAAPEYAERGV